MDCKKKIERGDIVCHSGDRYEAVTEEAEGSFLGRQLGSRYIMCMRASDVTHDEGRQGIFRKGDIVRGKISGKIYEVLADQAVDRALVRERNSCAPPVCACTDQLEPYVEPIKVGDVVCYHNGGNKFIVRHIEVESVAMVRLMGDGEASDHLCVGTIRNLKRA